METAFSLRRSHYRDLPGWGDDDPTTLIDGLRRSSRYVREVKPYRTGSLGISVEDLSIAFDAAERFSSRSAAEARGFFETHFEPFLIELPEDRHGLVTAFYEPEVEVSDKPDSEWCYPFYRRPDDLIDLTDDNRPAELDPSYRFGRITSAGIVAYPDRREIDQGFLDGRKLEIAWARSKEDVFFAHVQGAALLRFRDGTKKRITYAAKAGHPFSAIGKLLIERGEIALEEISMQSIRAWLRSHPDQADDVYWHNRSYIFFSSVDVGDEALGPVAAAKVQLTPGRSLAVDRLIHTFGVPFFVSSPSLTRLDSGRPFNRLMLAQETGTAIVGPARGDIFTGTGELAGELAGAVRNAANFYILIPRTVSARY